MVIHLLVNLKWLIDVIIKMVYIQLYVFSTCIDHIVGTGPG